MQSQPDVVVTEPPARQPRLAEGVLALPDVLLVGTSPVGLQRKVGNDEVHAREQCARAPFNLLASVMRVKLPLGGVM